MARGNLGRGYEEGSLIPLWWARIILALGLVLLTGRRALPVLVMRFRPTRLGCRFLSAEAEAGVLDGSPALQEALDRLKRLQYFLIGVKIEQMPLWGGRTMEVDLAARDHTAYASIVLQPSGAPASVYFYTPISGGGMVFTRDFEGGLEADCPGVSVRNVPGEEVEGVHGAHRARVADVQAQGFNMELRASPAGRIAATRAFYASPYYRRLTAWRDGLAGLSFGGSIVLLGWALLALAV